MYEQLLVDGGMTAGVLIMLLDLRQRVKALEVAVWNHQPGSQ